MIAELTIGPLDALVVVDVQNDFCPGGALAVPHGDEVIPPLNALLARFGDRGLPVFATRDWHPVDHASFRGSGGPWPPHCVQGTPGASLHPDLLLPCDVVIVSKGTRHGSAGYSGFEDTALGDELRKRGVGQILVGGLATDYCVRATVLDARRRGLEVVLVRDACRGIDASPGDIGHALDEMERAGARIADSSAVRA